MPRYSDDTLLKTAIEAAMLDRESFEDAVRGDAGAQAAARETLEKLKALKGKKLAAMSADEQHTAMLAFLYGEQWEIGYADCNPGPEYEKKSRAVAARYREVRLRRWGKTQLEVLLESATPVSIFDLK